MDQEDFLRLIEQNRGILVKISGVYSNSGHDRSDLICEMILQLWKSSSQYRGDSKVSTWIYRVALNSAMNYKRRNDRQEFILLTNPEIYASKSCLRQEEDPPWVEELYESINQLDEINRGLILLHLDGFSHAEIANIMGMSVSNIGTRMHRIKKQLKDILTKQSN